MENKIITPFVDTTSEKITADLFPAGERIVDAKNAAGGKVKCVLFEDGMAIATVRKGKGKDVEMATMIAGKDKEKFMSALMASVTSIDGRQVIMEELGDLEMSDYMQLQVAFSELNF